MGTHCCKERDNSTRSNKPTRNKGLLVHSLRKEALLVRYSSSLETISERYSNSDESFQDALSLKTREFITQQYVYDNLVSEEDLGTMLRQKAWPYPITKRSLFCATLYFWCEILKQGVIMEPKIFNSVVNSIQGTKEETFWGLHTLDQLLEIPELKVEIKQKITFNTVFRIFKNNEPFLKRLIGDIMLKLFKDDPFLNEKLQRKCSKEHLAEILEISEDFSESAKNFISQLPIFQEHLGSNNQI